MKEWRLFKKDMIIFYLITVSIIVEGIKIIYILINTDYFVYGAINFIFVKKVNLECINISIRKLIEIERKEGCINKIIKIKIDIDRYK